VPLSAEGENDIDTPGPGLFAAARMIDGCAGLPPDSFFHPTRYFEGTNWRFRPSNLQKSQ